MRICDNKKCIFYIILLFLQCSFEKSYSHKNGELFTFLQFIGNLSETKTQFIGNILRIYNITYKYGILH